MMKFVEPIKREKKLLEIYEYLRNTSERDALMFRIGINTMLRISDIIKLKTSNFFDNGDIREYLRMHTKKRNKRLKIPINEVLRAELIEYRTILQLEDEDYLIFSMRNPDKHIDRHQAWRILKKACSKFGVKRFGTHGLRKTAAWRVYKETKDIALIQQMLSHSSPKVTIAYLGINQETLDEAFKKYSF